MVLVEKSGFSEYDEEILKKLWKINLMILSEFIEICNENNLEYFAAFGTALGAVRHKGFIPWDDDIDVYMFRDDIDMGKLFGNQKWQLWCAELFLNISD